MYSLGGEASGPSGPGEDQSLNRVEFPKQFFGRGTHISLFVVHFLKVPGRKLQGSGFIPSLQCFTAPLRLLELPLLSPAGPGGQVTVC